MKKTARRLLSLLACMAIMLSPQTLFWLSGTADGAAESYPTFDGQSSRIFDGATVKLTNLGDESIPAPVVWKECSDGTLRHPGVSSYDGFIYQYGHSLGSAYEITGKLTVNDTADGDDCQISLAFGASGIQSSSWKMIMLAKRKADGDEVNINFRNGFRSTGPNWAADSQQRDWTLPEKGETITYAIRVEGRTVTVQLDGQEYAPYVLEDRIDMNNTAWGFYIKGVDATLSDMYVGGIRRAAADGVYPTNNGDASHIVDGAMVRLLNAGNEDAPAVVEWKEHEDGTLRHGNVNGDYDGILFQSMQTLDNAYEIAGDIQVNATRTGEGTAALTSQLTIIFGASSIKSPGWKDMMLSKKDADGNVADLNYTNGFRSAGPGWNVNTAPDERAWSLPKDGESTHFVVRVENRTITAVVGGVEYPPYVVGTDFDMTNFAWGFYATGVDVIISNLYAGGIRREAADGAYPTKNGDASHLFEGAKVQLMNLGLNNPLDAPAVWKEQSDGTLRHPGTDASYDALLYKFSQRLGHSYEIAGDLTVNAMREGDNLNSQLSLVFGAPAINGDAMQLMMMSKKSSDGDVANDNYINGFRSNGFAWKADSSERDWELPAAGTTVHYVIRVENRTVTVSIDGTVYDSYQLGDTIDMNNSAWGFYVEGVDVTVSNMYVGVIRADADENGAYPTKDGDDSRLMDGATVRVLNLGQDPAPIVWKEYEDGTLQHPGIENSFDLLLYEYGRTLGDAYEIAGDLTVNAIPGIDSEGNDNLYSQLSIVFGSPEISGNLMQFMMLSKKSDTGEVANINYTNGFYSSGFGWKADSSERDWSLPAAGTTVRYVIRVENRVVTVSLDGKKYASYVMDKTINMDNIAWGFYATGVDVTLANLYAGPVRPDEDGSYPTKDGDASRLVDGATVQLLNLGQQDENNAPVVWKEYEDGTLRHEGLDGFYDALLYQYPEKLGEQYEIAGDLTVNETRGDLASQLSIVFGAPEIQGNAMQLMMLSKRGEDDKEKDEQYGNGFRSAGPSWTTASYPDPREWALPTDGETMHFVIRVEGRRVTAILNGVRYASYTIHEAVSAENIAWGFYASGVDLSLSNLYFGEIRQEADGSYPSVDGDASRLFDGSTVRLLNLGLNNPSDAPVVWKEHNDGTLRHPDAASSYDLFLFEYPEKFGDSYELAGNIKINATRAGSNQSQLSIVFGSPEISGSTMQLIMLSKLNDKGEIFNLNYTNGFRGAGASWEDPNYPSEREWSLPKDGGMVSYVIRVQGRQVSVLLNGKAYAAYELNAAINRDNIAWGFYADGVDVTVSDMYFGAVRPDTDQNGAYPTKDGDPSRLFENARVRLLNLAPVSPAPVVWKEHDDGTLRHEGTDGSYDALFYTYENTLGDSYELSGDFTINAVRDNLNSQLSIMFGAPEVNGDAMQLMMMSKKSDKGEVATLNYTNGFRSSGFEWKTDSSEREWSLPAVGKKVSYVIQVKNRTVHVTLDGKTYALYDMLEGVSMENIAWGFYIEGVDVTLSNMYVGKVRNPDDVVEYPTHDGDKSKLFPGATVRLINLQPVNPAPVIWKERSDGTLIYPSHNAYNGILYQYDTPMGDSYEIAGKLTINSVKHVASEITFIFAAGDIVGSMLQGAMLSSLDNNGDVATLNYTNGFRGAGLSWAPETYPEEREWALPAAGESVDFVIRVADKEVTVTLGGVEYASYRIVDAIDFGSVAWGFYADSANVTLSNLYYGPLRGSGTTTTTQDEEDGYTVTRYTTGATGGQGNQTGGNGGDGENGGDGAHTGERRVPLVVAAIALLTAVCALAVLMKKEFVHPARKS